MNLTDAACKRIFDLIQKDPEKEYIGLRVYISGGGCSGFQYGFLLEEQKQEDDFTVPFIKNDQEYFLLVDPISLEYLNQAVLDFTKDLMGQRFIVNNPNVKTTCGCGLSFSV